MKYDLSLYLVTQCDTSNVFSAVKAAVEGGVRIVQLREKEKTTRQIIEIGKKLQKLLKPYRVPLIINDRVDIAKVIQADGVHLGQSDLSVAEARSILGPNALIGLSVETTEQVLEAQNFEVDYLAASPVFSTTTKTDHASPWGLENLKLICNESPHPIVAIGGINESNAREVLDCGVTGLCLISAIFNAPCPNTAAAQFSNLIRDHHALKSTHHCRI
jgi:thiamine-phosphate pyrophosphorylase